MAVNIRSGCSYLVFLQASGQGVVIQQKDIGPASLDIQKGFQNIPFDLSGRAHWLNSDRIKMYYKGDWGTHHLF